MPSRILLVFFVFSLTYAYSQKPGNDYRYTVDLTQVVNDKVYVELIPPKIDEKEITFFLPKIIPGTYAIADYGRYVSDFKVFDKKGNLLEVKKLDENSWRILKAKKAVKISYWVDDTWDTKKEGPEIFWPAGTNIEQGKNFVLNSSGFFGYFEGMKDTGFQLNVVRPGNFMAPPG